MTAPLFFVLLTVLTIGLYILLELADRLLGALAAWLRGDLE